MIARSGSAWLQRRKQHAAVELQVPALALEQGKLGMVSRSQFTPKSGYQPVPATRKLIRHNKHCSDHRARLAILSRLVYRLKHQINRLFHHRARAEVMNGHDASLPNVSSNRV